MTPDAFREQAHGLGGLVVIHVGLTALRDFRVNFAVEIWTPTGLQLLGRVSGRHFLLRRVGGAGPGRGIGILFLSPPASPGGRLTSRKTLEDIAELYAARGGLHYGEGVTQLEHALQSAVLAKPRGRRPL